MLLWACIEIFWAKIIKINKLPNSQFLCQQNVIYQKINPSLPHWNMTVGIYRFVFGSEC